MNGFVSQSIKMIPAFKGFFVISCIVLFSLFISENAEFVLTAFCVFVTCISIKKSWFIGFVSFMVWSREENVIIDCGKMISDWLMRFSSAAIVSVFIMSLVEKGFIVNKQGIIFLAAFSALASAFVSLRIAKHISEGIRRVNTRDDLRDIIRREYGDVKFEYDDLDYAKIKQLISEYNVAPPQREGIKEYLKPILERHGLLSK